MPKTPDFLITYQGADLSASVKQTIREITFTDVLVGAASRVDIKVNDERGDWLDSLFPQKGQYLTLELFFREASTKIVAGNYQVDDILYSIAPDTITIGALAIPFFGSQIREKRTATYTNTNLQNIVSTIASRNNLQVAGTVPSVALANISQSDKSDLDLLLELSEKFGSILKIEGQSLLFLSSQALENESADKTYIKQSFQPGASFRSKNDKIYQYCRLKYTVSGSSTEATATATDSGVSNNATLYISGDAENATQAQLIANEALRRANGYSVTGDFVVEGDTNLIPGINIQINSIGQLSGKYQILEVRHTLNVSSGWRSSCSVRRV